MRIHVLAVAVSVVGAIVVACTADPDGPPLIGYATDAGIKSVDPGACSAKEITPLDPATLPTCCEKEKGAAHCVPKDNVDPFVATQLAECAGTGALCEPDPLIRNPTMVLEECVSLGNAPGACVSVCVPQVQQYLSLLPQADCPPDERCAPCINPLDNTNTGACDIGKKKADACGALPEAGSTEGGAPACPYTGPDLVDPKMFPECQPACGGSHCVPEALVPAPQRAQLLRCNSTDNAAGYCAPDSLVKTGGNGLPPTCVSAAGAEGRCLSECIPLVAEKAAALPRATCGEHERCAPCFDPTAADPTAPTGACAIACDQPKAPPTVLKCPYTGADLVDPKVFDECEPKCGGAHCVPEALVPVSQQAQLARCTGGFCTPDSLAKSGGNALPKTCKSVGDSEGRCLSECLPLVAEKAKLLPKDTCGDNERCVPCFDPTGADPTAPTGACQVACDKNAEPPLTLSCPYKGPDLVDPKVFDECAPACAGAHCVDRSLVPEAQRSQLATCGANGLCAPDSVTRSANHTIPTSCQPFDPSASEGRCTSKCLPAVKAQASQLTQKNCTADELCAPCNDPLTGVSTGACNLACDKPAKPAFKFPLCCDFNGTKQGTCVPKSSIPADQASALEPDACPTTDAAANYLCVPNEYLPNAPATAIQKCHAFYTVPPLPGLIDAGDGACVSKCANTSLGGLVFGQSDCADANHICIGCATARSQGMAVPGCPP